MGLVELSCSQPGAVLAQSMVYFNDCKTNLLQSAYYVPSTAMLEPPITGSVNTNLGMRNYLNLYAVGDAQKTKVAFDLHRFTRSFLRGGTELLRSSAEEILLNGGADYDFPKDSYGIISVSSDTDGAGIFANVLRVRLLEGGIVDFVMPTALR